MTSGSIRSHGYQFMRSDHARLERQQAIRRQEIPGVGTVEIVPLTGGRRRCWDVCATWRDRAGNGQASMYIAYDELEASGEFHKLCRELKGELP